MQRPKAALLSLLVVLLITACGKESATISSERPTDYLNLVSGKYIIYQLDSLVKSPTNDTALITQSYQAKDLIDTIVTDNLGRPGWRVFRFLRPVDSNNEADWQPSDTYLITPTNATVELIENNLRYLKLIAPIEQGNSWLGNRYINTTPGGPIDYLQAWQYNYSETNHSFAPFDNTIDSCITILQSDDGESFADNYNPQSADLDGYRIYSIEVYAKNIGLIYKDLVYWNYEKRTVDGSGNPIAPHPTGNRTGGGIRLRMLSHN